MLRKVLHVAVLLLGALYLASMFSTAWIDQLPPWAQDVALGVLLLAGVLDVASLASPRVAAFIAGKPPKD